MLEQDIRALLETHFPEAKVDLEDLAGDADHFALRIVSPQFQGKRRVMRHQMVYQALQGHVGTTLHALSITALSPEEALEE